MISSMISRIPHALFTLPAAVFHIAERLLLHRFYPPILSPILYHPDRLDDKGRFIQCFPKSTRVDANQPF